MPPASGVCPRCKRTYPRPARVCAVDNTPLVDEERFAAAQSGPHSMSAKVPLPPPTPPPSPSTGRTEKLGPYRLIKLLGEGGMARIYLAEHEKIGRICAIKRLHADHFEDRITVARFLAEARAVSDITHPNLVAVYDVVEEPNEIYIVMEYLDGHDVAQVLRDERRLTPPRAAEIAAQACDGLAAVHEKNIIHRDLKPENIFLMKDGSRERVKLLDFGVARLTIDRPKELQTRSGLTVGTPTYMSPEQATASEIDCRSDLYAIGVLLYEMLAGAPPFTGAGYGDVMLMHVNDPPTPISAHRSDVPPWLELVVMKCLEKEPEARFQTAMELATALRAGATAESVLPPPNAKRKAKQGSPYPAISRRKSRLPVGIAVGAAAAIALAAGIAIVAGSRHPVADAVVVPSPPPPKAAPPPPAKKLSLSSVPPGASVALDGKARCATPCDVELPPGARTVALDLTAEGFEVEHRILEAASAPDGLRFTLRKATPLKVAHPPSHGPKGPKKKTDRNATVDPFHQKR
jgi:serine/threonine-protein kinase